MPPLASQVAFRSSGRTGALRPPGRRTGRLALFARSRVPVSVGVSTVLLLLLNFSWIDHHRAPPASWVPGGLGNYNRPGHQVVLQNASALFTPNSYLASSRVTAAVSRSPFTRRRFRKPTASHVAATAGAGSLSNSTASNKVWLYTLIGADYPGTGVLLPHWLRHYRNLGFVNEDMIILINHNSTKPSAEGEYQSVLRTLAEPGLRHTLWTGRYSSDAHLKIKLQLLTRHVRNPEDWIVIADSDELHNLRTRAGGVHAVLQRAQASGTNWVLGQLVDRVSANGSLTEVRAQPSLFHQYPLNCQVVKSLSKGYVWKVAAFKAFWRSNTGNHFIVDADRARSYFGAAPAGVHNMRGGWYGAEDLFALTPYATYAARYQYAGRPAHPGLWSPRRYSKTVPVFHFKWHAGVLASAADRLAHYRGAAGTPGGSPRYGHYFESENIVNLLSINRTIPLQAAECQQDATLFMQTT